MKRSKVSDVAIMLRLRLLLPEDWTKDVARMDKACVPERLHKYPTKPKIVNEERSIESSLSGCALVAC